MPFSYLCLQKSGSNLLLGERYNSSGFPLANFPIINQDNLISKCHSFLGVMRDNNTGGFVDRRIKLVLSNVISQICVKSERFVKSNKFGWQLVHELVPLFVLSDNSWVFFCLAYI